MLDWFDDFSIAGDLAPREQSLQLHDRYLHFNKQALHTLQAFDQRSANEGFLFILFYTTLFVSNITPRFFAIDNIDASLNPGLCMQLMKELASLSEQHDKQALLTTHNPAILDGLNLHDPEQKLFVVSRNQKGHTRVNEVHPPESTDSPPLRLSEAFLRGYLGATPRF